MLHKWFLRVEHFHQNRKPHFWACCLINNVFFLTLLLKNPGTSGFWCANKPPFQKSFPRTWNSFSLSLTTIFFSCLCVHSPFDVEDLTPSTGNVSKASALQRRMSMYSQGTPETPTFKDHSFFVSSLWPHVYVVRSPRAVQTLQMLHCFTRLSFFPPGSSRLPLQILTKQVHSWLLILKEGDCDPGIFKTTWQIIAYLFFLPYCYSTWIIFIRYAFILWQ